MMKFSTPYCIVKSLLVLAFLALPLRALAYVNIPWILNGNASYGASGRVTLTPKNPTQKGTMWNPCTISLNSNFT